MSRCHSKEQSKQRSEEAFRRCLTSQERSISSPARQKIFLYKPSIKWPGPPVHLQAQCIGDGRRFQRPRASRCLLAVPRRAFNRG